MNIIDWKNADPEARRAALGRPSAGSRDDVFRQAEEVIAAVRAEGDAAIRRYTQKFGGPSLDQLRVMPAEFREARASLAARVGSRWSESPTPSTRRSPCWRTCGT